MSLKCVCGYDLLGLLSNKIYQRQDLGMFVEREGELLGRRVYEDHLIHPK